MPCRRDKPRSAFQAQIRAERGTVSAETADADECGTHRGARHARIGNSMRPRAEERRARPMAENKNAGAKASVCAKTEGVTQRRTVRLRLNFQSGSETARLTRLVRFSSFAVDDV
jgi:hypothetical protein